MVIQKHHFEFRDGGMPSHSMRLCARRCPKSHTKTHTVSAMENVYFIEHVLHCNDHRFYYLYYSTIVPLLWYAFQFTDCRTRRDTMRNQQRWIPNKSARFDSTSYKISSNALNMHSTMRKAPFPVTLWFYGQSFRINLSSHFTLSTE